MATKGKEKRGTSPSNSDHNIDATQRKRSSPKPSLPNFPDKDHANPSQKQVPHYLRPTLSSRNDQPAASKQVMRTTQKPSLNRRTSFDKNGPADINAQKPSFNRRASFDKPPSSSFINKALQSPTTNTRERTNNIQPKPISMSERMALKTVTHKAVKSLPNNSLSRHKSIKRSTSSAGAIKRETKPPSRSNISPDHATQTFNSIESAEPEDKESLIVNHEVEDELLKLEGEVEFPPEISIPENNKELDDVADYHDSTEVIEKLKSCDTSTVSEDQNQSPLAEDDEVVEEENEDKTLEGEETNNIDNPHHEEEKENKDESDNNEPSQESLAADEPKILESDVNEGEESAIEKEDIVEEGSQNKLDSKEGEEAEDVVKEAKPEMANVVVKRQGGGQGGKKDSPAYNDVIEETASKLLEKRKNKVSALVGAFETVISLQEPETPS